MVGMHVVPEQHRCQPERYMQCWRVGVMYERKIFLSPSAGGLDFRKLIVHTGV